MTFILSRVLSSKSVRRPDPKPFRGALRQWLATVIAVVAGLCLASAAIAQPLTRVVFGTNWFAQAEHGGFYQAVAEGLYRRAGLDVEIRMGGPQVNGMQLLLAGQLDLFMGFDIQVLEARDQGLPVVTLAASFQKDPAVLIAHPDVHRIEELKGRPIFISAASNTTFWPWLRGAYGFADDQKRPYSFSVQPFLVDKRSATQGYVTSEPWSVEKGGVKPTVFLLADLGYPPYAQTIVATDAWLARNADVARRFVQATAEGYRSYLANPGPANALIRKANPQMEEGLLQYGLARMREYGLVTGGDAARGGIMTMTDARWKQTIDFLVGAGLLKTSTEARRAYTLDIVNRVKVLP
jgi:NitT/TauT family transport system substrate-binding protein